jgi:hypothetical protein
MGLTKAHVIENKWREVFKMFPVFNYSAQG